MIRLSVYEGTRRRIVDVSAPTVRIGRDPDCEVHLPGDATVSRVHAVLRETDAGWQVTDEGSRNGTFVNGERLTAPRMLATTDRIAVGGFVLVQHDDDDRFVETAAADEHQLARLRLETGLSAREIEVLRLVAAGLGDEQIATSLVIEVSTARTHLDRIRDKTGQRRRPELIRWAIEHGLG